MPQASCFAAGPELEVRSRRRPLCGRRCRWHPNLHTVVVASQAPSLAKFLKASRFHAIQTIASHLTPRAACVYTCSRKQPLSAGPAAFVLAPLEPHVILSATSVRAQSFRTFQALMSAVWHGDASIDR